MKCSGHGKLLSELSELLKFYSSLQIPPRESWFQYVRRVYATAINFLFQIETKEKWRLVGRTFRISQEMK